jgi:hypothetical protein
MADLQTLLSRFLSDLYAATITWARNSLGTTSTDGSVTQNTTPATAGATVQISPRNRLTGTGWDSDDAVSRTVSFFTETLPITGATVTGTWKIGYIDPVTSAITYPGTLSSDGGFVTTGWLQTNPANGFLLTNQGRFRTTADGAWRISNNAQSNTFDMILADWGTTLSAEAVSVANGATLNLGTAPRGFLYIEAVTENAGAIYRLNGGANTVSEVNDVGTLFTVTKDNASTVNIYFLTDHYELQNNRATQNFRVLLIGGTS